MAEQANNGTSGAPGAGAAQPPFQARVVGQYIKDLSFENPNIGKLVQSPGDNPNLKLEVNVNATRVGDDLYESAIDFKANASNKSGVIYELELVYAGLFKVENVPQQALEPFLLINCPSLLFPFLRRLAADLTREGGFPPLLLDPIDFAGLYVRRQQRAAAPKAEPAPKT
ncbi:MAG: protein-export chaperone SecB [Hyphomicrobiaceae bacterium]|nr:protein-export chaperone SecB [Hyphomicrobiaceae bacterium]